METSLALCIYYCIPNLPLNIFPPSSQKLVLSFKKFCKNLILADNEIFFYFYFFILAERGRGRRSVAEKEDGSNGTIVPFVTSDNSRYDHEMCWLLDVRSLTNPLDLFISSPKTKGSVIPQAEWSWSEDSANISQGRTNVNIQSTPVEWAVRKGGGPHLPCKA